MGCDGKVADLETGFIHQVPRVEEHPHSGSGASIYNADEHYESVKVLEFKLAEQRIHGVTPGLERSSRVSRAPEPRRPQEPRERQLRPGRTSAMAQSSIGSVEDL